MRHLPLLLALLAFPALAGPPVAVDDICIVKQDTPTICPDPLANDSGDDEPVFLVKENDMESAEVRYSLDGPTEAGGTMVWTAEGPRYTPPSPEFLGRDRKRYRIFSMNGGEAIGTIEIAVTCP